MLFPFHDDNPTSRFPLVTCAIIGLNVASLLYIGWLPPQDAEILTIERAFVPARVAQLRDPNLVVPVRLHFAPVPRPNLEPVYLLFPVRSQVIATFFSTMFLHAGWMHLIGNMWFLWLFGNNIEDRLGHMLFMVLYVVGGVAASLAHWAMISADAMNTPVIGASGAVAAVMGAYIVTFPRSWIRSIFILIIIPIVVELPAAIVLGIWFIGQLLDATRGDPLLTGGVAWWAHVGGFVVGMALMPVLGAIAPRHEPTSRRESEW
jgi:membrane associated rhomboid family serine protease